MQAELRGEDSGAFDLSAQSIASWAKFVGVFTVVMGALWFLWIDPQTGFGDDFIRLLSSICSDNSTATMLLLLSVFGVAHSGLASLRPKAEAAINSLLEQEGVGERVWRVLFGVVSLPLAVSCIVFFINHRYDGVQLWDVRSSDAVHAMCWVVNFVSFWFLYPSTFNLLEIAAVDKPKFHMWETGIMRITRHPQMVGQLMWCMAHTLWIGNSFMLATSFGLMVHHLFGCWHGDQRLANKYGEAFEAVKSRTSVLPFAAIAEGRQTLPEDYYKEFLRAPYVAITVGTVAAYFAHPLMQGYSYLLKW
ncbi:hypothetical protein GUITHDRAFT_63717 [Guillardia theta CCMP2712]|uniref:NnrU domain-containing protein n=2 Tax=Guillardia theta TaxID=55529 RepID=L1K1I3_GUITC|nr:hypothetical protein GUITHDRAFT_63717 [Guillardia theta CCMP2712]EKX54233.1 hypothetical protein GUITHDRAFT_63717 [Guillardia theta CCMP2712]|eukprot:XP_005841213.1 hypothetical protein GUITHDRAFT_63717 [Guillardia theta CCMP2712]